MGGPRNIVIVAAPGERYYEIYDRDTQDEILPQSLDQESISERNDKARQLHELTGWPVVKHR